MSDEIINGIDVSEYFIEVVDEGGSTIDYKILPNSERLLVDKIFNHNQQLQRLKQENKELKAKYKSKKYILENTLPENSKYAMKCGEYKQALEEIRNILNKPYPCQFLEPISYANHGYSLADFFIRLICEAQEKIDEVLND